jgi:hypothetical protein
VRGKSIGRCQKREFIIMGVGSWRRVLGGDMVIGERRDSFEF